MFKKIYHKALIIVPALYGLLLSSDRATLVAFSANHQLGEVFASTSLVGVAMLVGACSLGATVSSLFAGQLCDKFGFLPITRIACLLWCLGCVGAYFSPQNVYIVLCKLAKGFGVGLASVSAPLYMFEVLLPPHRSSAIGWASVFNILSQASMYGLGILLRVSLHSPADAFHFCWLAENLWGILVIVTSAFLPESPKFLARKGDWDHATSSLERIIQQKEIDLVPVSLQPASFSDLFSKQIRSKFFFAVAIQLFARASCIFGLTHIIHYMLAFCRLSDTMVESLYAVIYAIQFFFTLLSIYVMKSSRRKDMLAYGLFLLSVAFVCLGSTSYVHATTSPLPMAYAPVVQVTLVPASTVLALTGFAFSVSSLLITSSSMSFVIEVLPCDSRSRGVSIAMSAAWTVETLASTLSVGLSNLNPFVFFFVLSTICFVGMIVVLFVYEERVNKEGLPFPVAVLGHGPDQEKAEDPEGPEGLAELGGPEGQGGPEDLEGPDCPENLQGPKGLVGLDDPNTQQFVAENANSETLETGSVSEKIFHPQNFITIHKRSAEDVPTNLPKFVVTEPVQMATAKSELSVLEMKTADTRFHSKFPDPAAHLEDPDRDRLVATNEVNRLAPYKTSDSKVTVSGMWSEVSDPDY